MSMNLKCITTILNSINDRTQLTADGSFTPISVTNAESLNIDGEFKDADFNESLTYCVDRNLVELDKEHNTSEGYLILCVTKKGEEFLQENI